MTYKNITKSDAFREIDSRGLCINLCDGMRRIFLKRQETLVSKRHYRASECREWRINENRVCVIHGTRHKFHIARTPIYTVYRAPFSRGDVQKAACLLLATYTRQLHSQ